MFRERICHKEKATLTSREGKEQRELTLVQPLCMAKPLKWSKWKPVWREVAAPLFGGSRPLTAGKGVQHKEKGRNLKSDAAGSLFGGSRTPATQKGAHQLEKERLDHGTPNEQAAGPLFARFGLQDPRKGLQQLENEWLDRGTPNEQAAGPLFARFGLQHPQKGVQQPQKSHWYKANLLDPFLQDFGAKKVQKGAQQAFTKLKKEPKVCTKILF